MCQTIPAWNLKQIGRGLSLHIYKRPDGKAPREIFEVASSNTRSEGFVRCRGSKTVRYEGELISNFSGDQQSRLGERGQAEASLANYTRSQGRVNTPGGIELLQKGEAH